MDRNIILADFQAATGIDDIETCICILEQHDWDLQTAMMQFLSDADQPSSLQEGPHITSAPVVTIDDDLTMEASGGTAEHNANHSFSVHTQGKRPPVAQTRTTVTRNNAGNSTTAKSVPSSNTRSSSRRSDASSSTKSSSSGSGITIKGARLPRHQNNVKSGTAAASTSTGGGSGAKRRFLHFTINFDMTNFDVILPDTETVYHIKVQLSDLISNQQHSHHVSASDMRIHGFKDKLFSDSTVLSTMNLPREVSLKVTSSKTLPSVAAAAESAENRCNSEFKLNIFNLDTDTTYPLTFKGDTILRQIKSDVYSLWGIPRNQQVWSGWPSRSRSSDKLADMTIDLEHHLTVRAGDESAAVVSPVHISSSPEPLESDYAAYELLDDNDVMNTGLTSSLQPLIGHGVAAQSDAVAQFIVNFQQRYSSSLLKFFQGTLEAALNAASQCSIPEQRPVAVYLHHDHSITANIFCSTVLLNEGVAEYINNNFVLWGWDMTLPENASAFLTHSTRLLNLEVAAKVRMMKQDELPSVLILHRNRTGSVDLLDVIGSTGDSSSTLTQFMISLDQFKLFKSQEMEMDMERQQRELERVEMVSAYEASLLLDKQKEKMKEEEEKKRATEEREQQEAMRRAEQLVPSEPAADIPCATLRIRLPQGGGQQQRRFLPNHKLRNVAAFIATLGYSSHDYRLVTTFPRRDLSSLSPDTSLQDAGLCPQETVLVEER